MSILVVGGDSAEMFQQQTGGGHGDVAVFLSSFKSEHVMVVRQLMTSWISPKG